MTDASAKHYEQRFGGELLESVSRTFYLSLKFLPKEFRGSVSLAYLLARATDTVADAADAPVGDRLELLADLGRAFEREAAVDSSSLVSSLKNRIVPHLDDDGEARLLNEVGGVLEWHDHVPEDHRGPIREVLDPILRGQILDVERFPKTTGSGGREIRCLTDAEELDEYTYLVAGCVGGFWTDICGLELPSLTRTKSVSELRELGVRMGKGLQLINVIRDFPRDLKAGRCYLPAEELKAAGFDPDALTADQAESIWPLWEPWMRLCREHLDAGLEYVLDLRPKRIIVPTALPLILAVRTLDRLETAEWPEVEQRLKIGRDEVGRLVTQTTLAASLSRGRLERLYRG